MSRTKRARVAYGYGRRSVGKRGSIPPPVPAVTPDCDIADDDQDVHEFDSDGECIRCGRLSQRWEE